MTRRLLAGMLLVLALGYALGSAPSDLPWSEEWRIIRTMGFDNAVVFVLLNAVALYAPVLAALMVPSMVSANQVPVWPFLLGSVFFGTVAVLPYLILWEASPRHSSRNVPPSSAEMAGGHNWLVRLTEGKALPRALLAAEAVLGLLLAGTNAATWADFWRLFHSSRVVHLAALDFVALSVLSAILAAYDASRRGMTRNALTSLAVGLSAIPLVGPTLYLLYRPSAYVAPGAPVRVRARRAGAAVRGAAEKGKGWLEHVLPEGVHDVVMRVWEAVPGRRWFEARLAALGHKMRRVGSTVFQGLHTERERRPIRQTSVSSEHGIEMDDADEHKEQVEVEEETEEETDDLDEEDQEEEQMTDEEEEAPAGDELDVINRDQAPAMGGRTTRKAAPKAAAADSAGRALGKASAGSSGRAASKPQVVDINFSSTRVTTRTS